MASPLRREVKYRAVTNAQTIPIAQANASIIRMITIISQTATTEKITNTSNPQTMNHKYNKGASQKCLMHK